MGRKTRVYSRVKEGEEMIEKLCKKYDKLFWSVQPKMIAVMGVDNVERSEKAVTRNPVWCKLQNVKGVEKGLFQEFNVPIRYIIEAFWSDWNVWSDALKLAVLADKLLEITPESEQKNRRDCVGFKVLLDKIGVNWAKDNGKGLPNLLLTDIDFDMDLRPGLEELKAMEEDGEGDDVSDIDEVEEKEPKKKAKKEKKEKVEELEENDPDPEDKPEKVEGEEED